MALMIVVCCGCSECPRCHNPIVILKESILLNLEVLFLRNIPKNSACDIIVNNCTMDFQLNLLIDIFSLGYYTLGSCHAFN